jgi:long-chain acyl-CoA synthetase
MNDRNLVDLHRRQAERLGPRPALRYKRHGLYCDLSWIDYREQSVACAAALVDAGIQSGDRVGLLSENRVEWLIVDMGLLTAGAVCVPPHAPLTARQVQFQLADAEVSWLFVSTLSQLEKIRQVRDELPMLRGVVVFDDSLGATDAVPWKTLLQHGRRVRSRWSAELDRRAETLSADDLATVMYTSGTTGNPKGVMLTHGNLLSNATVTAASSNRDPDGLVLNWLPYSHIFARLVDHYGNLASGVTVALAESPDTVIANLDELHPTQMSAVPRFYEKVLAAVASPDTEETGRRMRKVFGPRMDWLCCGGAPLPLAVLDAYRAAGLNMYPGYGLTESSPVISFNSREHQKRGTVGPPLPGIEVKIAPDGEILTRGPHVMKGYWKNPEATAEAIQEGWLHTGDLGELDGDGFLSITGRKKELLVMSSGKKVVPSHIERLLLADPCIDQVVVCGEGKSYLTALVIPQWDNMRKEFAQSGITIDHAPPESLARDPRIVEQLRMRIDTALKDLAACEQIKRFAVLPHPLSVAGDELTVSLKVRRSVVLEKNSEIIQALYCERGV